MRLSAGINTAPLHVTPSGTECAFHKSLYCTELLELHCRLKGSLVPGTRNISTWYTLCKSLLVFCVKIVYLIKLAAVQ